MNLQAQIEELYRRENKEFGEEYFRAFEEFKAKLNDGTIRAAMPATIVEFEPSSQSG